MARVRKEDGQQGHFRLDLWVCVCLGEKIIIIRAADIEVPKWTVLLKISPMQNCDHLANKCLTDLAISIHTDSNRNLTKCSTW